MRSRIRLVFGASVRRAGLRFAAVVAVFSTAIVPGYAQLSKKLLVPAQAYQPSCADGDDPCRVWARFRGVHPYPYQAVAGRWLPDGSLAIIISEPPPSIAAKDLEPLVRKAFGSDLISMTRYRWRMGVDGWLEDVVLRVNAGPQGEEPLSDPVMRDRVAFLHLALFGTAFGAHLESSATDEAIKAPKGPPNLKLTPYDVRQWMGDPRLTWTAANVLEAAPATWKTVAAAKATGTYVSADENLVALMLPVSLLRGAPTKPASLDPLRAPFRSFALLSDAIVGIFQGPTGHAAILGRWRSRPLSEVPPLRFETFKLIATQSVDELSQSYERRALFAGKLLSGDYEYRDWAPIYLSESLVDTELGALLNTTDQLLKSWSEAGAIEYLFFNYPQPGDFPFGKKPLSEVVEELNGSSQVLFNWNTAGAGVLISTPEGKVLTATQTGALPITYGADLKGTGDVTTGTLREQEEKAYNYFARQTDANLERVVSYTMLYQFCRALAAASPASPIPPVIPAAQSPAMVARRKGAAVRVNATLALIQDLRAGKVELKPALKTKADSALERMRSRYPTYTDPQLAGLVADRFSVESRQLDASRQAQLTSRVKALEAAEAKYTAGVAAYKRQVADYNASLDLYKGTLSRGYGIMGSYLRSQKQAIDLMGLSLLAQKAELEKMEESFDAFIKSFESDPLNEFRNILYEIAQDLGIENVRRDFVAKHDYAPAGAIKTPSIVVSWNKSDLISALFTTGGHNLNSRALRLEQDATVEGIAIERTSKGVILRYNPSRAASVEANASQIARAVEHQRVRDTAVLSSMIPEKPPVLAKRNVALALPESPAPPEWNARLGMRHYSQESKLVSNLGSIAEKNDCCVLVAYDSNGVAFAAEKNLKPPPGFTSYEIRDSSSMNSFLGGIAKRPSARGGRTVVFLDTPQSHVEAATLNLAGVGRADMNLSKLAESLGARKAGVVEARIDAISTADLKGRSSMLRSVYNRVETGASEFYERFIGRQTSQAWTRAEISTLPSEKAAQLVSGLQWNAASDGIPSAVMVKFGSAAPSAGSIDLGVVAGFSEASRSLGEASLKAVAESNRATAALRQVSLAEYAATVRNDLQSMTNVKVRRLSIVVKQGETTTHLSFRFCEEPRSGRSTVKPS